MPAAWHGLFPSVLHHQAARCEILGGPPRLATHPAYNAKEEAGAADPPGPGYAHRPSTFLNLYNPKRGEVPALQYLQAFGCRNVSCRLSCSCPAHACAPIFTSIWLQEPVLQTVLQLSCACLRTRQWWLTSGSFLMGSSATTACMRRQLIFDSGCSK